MLSSTLSNLLSDFISKPDVPVINQYYGNTTIHYHDHKTSKKSSTDYDGFTLIILILGLMLITVFALIKFRQIINLDIWVLLILTLIYIFSLHAIVQEYRNEKDYFKRIGYITIFFICCLTSFFMLITNYNMPQSFISIENEWLTFKGNYYTFLELYPIKPYLGMFVCFLIKYSLIIMNIFVSLLFLPKIRAKFNLKYPSPIATLCFSSGLIILTYLYSQYLELIFI